MDPRTHLLIDPDWVGRPLEISPGRARVALETRPEMAADEHGLVHGGFIFGLADYAAMLAVNEPTVVLGRAEVRFTAPCVVGETLVATAVLHATDGKKRSVDVRVTSGGETVTEAELLCIVPERHVLDAAD